MWCPVVGKQTGPSLLDCWFIRRRPRTNVRGQSFETAAEVKILALRPLWPRGLASLQATSWFSPFLACGPCSTAGSSQTHWQATGPAPSSLFASRIWETPCLTAIIYSMYGNIACPPNLPLLPKTPPQKMWLATWLFPVLLCYGRMWNNWCTNI